MIIPTCGDLGGKPCEMVGTGKCPLIYPGPDEIMEPSSGNPACAPMVETLKAKEESARWKRAAERLASVLGAYSKNIGDGFEMTRTNTALRTSDAWLREALEAAKQGEP